MRHVEPGFPLRVLLQKSNARSGKLLRLDRLSLRLAPIVFAWTRYSVSSSALSGFALRVRAERLNPGARNRFRDAP